MKSVVISKEYGGLRYRFGGGGRRKVLLFNLLITDTTKVWVAGVESQFLVGRVLKPIVNPFATQKS